MGTDGSDRAEGFIHGDTSGLAAAAGAAGGAHVAILAADAVDEWHHALASTPNPPAYRHLVSVDDVVRGATAGGAEVGADGQAGMRGAQRLAGGVFLSAVETPTESAADLASFVRGAFEHASQDAGSLVVDDVGAVLGETANPDAALETLLTAAADLGAEVHTGVPSDDWAAALLSRHLSPSDDDAERAVSAAALEHLRSVDPTNFGYLRRHWREARRGLEAVEMSYPQAKQVHAAIPDPETTPRTLGAALQAFVTLGALDVWGDTVAANRYDLTAYDPVRANAIGDALDAHPE
ncbi:hypothetical protein [Halobaculum sp. D14]|uniref:hypothetical protein n=1 Tax=unclassified Halobaculum TaxID=2640896 RepID=UPI003EC10981